MISRPLEKTLNWNGKRLKLDLCFDNVLRMYELKRENDLSDFDKLDIIFDMFIKSRGKYSAKDKADIVNKIFTDFINIKVKSTGDNTQVVDFEQDAQYIYAGFRQAYGIDLHQQQGKLDWREFMALFLSLPDNTKIKEIMSIRGRKLPMPTKHNAEEIKAIQEAKAYWALKISEDEAEKSFQLGVDKLVASLTARAENG